MEESVGGEDVRKISSAQSDEVEAASGAASGGSARQSAAVGKLRDQVTLAGGKFTSLAISVKGCEDG